MAFEDWVFANWKWLLPIWSSIGAGFWVMCLYSGWKYGGEDVTFVDIEILFFGALIGPIMPLGAMAMFAVAHAEKIVICRARTPDKGKAADDAKEK